MSLRDAKITMFDNILDQVTAEQEAEFLRKDDEDMVEIFLGKKWVLSHELTCSIVRAVGRFLGNYVHLMDP